MKKGNTLNTNGILDGGGGGGGEREGGGKEPVLFVNEYVPEIRFRSKKGIETSQKLQY